MISLNNARFLVVLDTMWGRGGKAASWFAISPRNHSGRMLYRMTGCKFGDVWVTNACPQQTSGPQQHGTPSADWLALCLAALPEHCQSLPLLVCGKVAQQTFAKVKSYVHPGPVVQLAHPAARNWSKRRFNAAQKMLNNRWIIHN